MVQCCSDDGMHKQLLQNLVRILTKHAWLYTEMIAAETIAFQKGDLVISFISYEYCYALVREFPDLHFTLNAGINTINEHERKAHGVMLGRAAYNNPWNVLAHVDSAIYGAPPNNRRQVLEKYQIYGDSILRNYDPKPNPREVMKPFLGFFHSAPGNAVWKHKADAAFLRFTTMNSFFEETLVAIPDYVLDSPLTETPVRYLDTFANSKSRLPPLYSIREEIIYP